MVILSQTALGCPFFQVYLLEHEPASALSYAAMAKWIEETRRHLPLFHELVNFYLRAISLCQLFSFQYFLEYLNELRIKNLPAAETALHRYVDCSGLILMTKNIFDFGSSGRLTAPATSIIPMAAFRSLRYGPLLLADMHRRFGNE